MRGAPWGRHPELRHRRPRRGHGTHGIVAQMPRRCWFGLRYPVPLIKAPQHPQGLSPARPDLFIHHWEPSPLAQPRAALLPTLPSGLHAAPLPGRNPGLTTYFTRTSLHTLSHPHLTSSPHPRLPPWERLGPQSRCSTPAE